MYMVKLHISIFMLSIAVVNTGCSYHAAYPEYWPAIHSTAGNVCPEIAGRFHNAGQRRVSEGGSAQYQPPYLSSYFFTDMNKAAGATKILISWASTEHLQIRAEDNNGILMTTEMQLGKDFTCQEGSMIIKNNRTVAENVSGYERIVYLLSSATDGSLVVQIKSWAAGLVFVVPVAGSSTEWQRFQSIKQ